MKAAVFIIRYPAVSVSGGGCNNRRLRVRMEFTSSSTLPQLALSMPARPIQTRSHPGLIEVSRERTASRMRRLARLRSTAPPTFFPAMNPHRTMFPLLGAAFNTTNPAAQVRPSRLTRSNSQLFFSVSNDPARMLAYAFRLVADRQSPSAFCAACRHDTAATLRAHSR